MIEERGKRTVARNMLIHWALLSFACFFAVLLGDLEEHELDSLVALHWAVSIFTSGFALGAYGLDAAASQIIPALKEKQK